MTPSITTVSSSSSSSSTFSSSTLSFGRAPDAFATLLNSHGILRLRPNMICMPNHSLTKILSRTLSPLFNTSVQQAQRYPLIRAPSRPSRWRNDRNQSRVNRQKTVHGKPVLPQSSKPAARWQQPRRHRLNATRRSLRKRKQPEMMSLLQTTRTHRLCRRKATLPQVSFMFREGVSRAIPITLLIWDYYPKSHCLQRILWTTNASSASLDRRTLPLFTDLWGIRWMYKRWIWSWLDCWRRITYEFVSSTSYFLFCWIGLLLQMR